MALTHAEYQSLVEQAPILIWRANTSGLCDYFNERWFAFRGRNLEQEYGEGWAQGVHPEDLAGCLKTYAEFFQRREPFEMRYRLLRHDAEYRWILDRGAPFSNNDGSFAGYIGSCIDITDQVKAEEEIQAMRNRELQQLRGLLPICAWCKKVRNAQGYWQAVEHYIKTHTEVDFSHGICPDCHGKSLNKHDSIT